MKLTIERAALLKALAHPVRLRMVLALEKGERCACELTDLSPCDRTTSSKHLAVLREAGIVTDRREGTRILYSLRLGCVLAMLRCVNRFASLPMPRRTSFFAPIRQSCTSGCSTN